MSTTLPPNRIEGGIEWYSYERDGEIEEDCQCARCGSSVDFRECWDCGGEGGHVGEDIASSYDFGWIDDDAWVRCSTCRGKRGWWYCISSREYCLANPLPGREDIPSTASDDDDD